MSQPTTELPGHLLELMDDVVWTTTLDGRELIYANPALERVYGRPGADFLDNPDLWLELVHPDDRALAEQLTLNLPERGQCEATYRIIRPDGEVRWLHNRKHIIYDGTGQPQHIGGIATDITAQKQAESDSAQNQQLLAAFFTQALDGVFLMMLDEPVVWNDEVDKEAVLDYAFAHQRVTRVNPTLLAQYRATPEQFLGKTPNDLFQPAIAQGRAVWRQLLDQGQLRFESYAHRFDGTLMLIEGDYVCLQDGAGRITGHVGVQRDVTERKQAQEAMHQSERKFRGIVEQSPDAIVISDQTGQVVEWNRAAEEIYGLPKTKALGRKLWDVQFELGLSVDQTSERLERLKTAITGALNTGQGPLLNRLADVKIERPDGQQVYVQTIAFAFEGHGGYWLGSISRDVTHQKRIEQALKASEARYHQMFEGNKSVQLIVDPADGRIIDANAAACHFYGYDRPALTALRITDINTLSEAEVRQEMARVKTKDQLYFNFRHKLAGGEIRDVEVYSSPLEIEGQTLLYSIIHDITERVRSERKLAETNRRLEAFFENSPAPVSIFDRQGRYLKANHTVARIAQRPLAEIAGHSFTELLPPALTSAFYSRLETLLATQAPLTVKDAVEIDGETRVYQSTLFPIPTLDDSKPLFGAIANDITALEQTQQELRASEALMKQAEKVAMLGHWARDLRTGQQIWSDETYRIFELDPARVQPAYQTFLEIVHPEDRAEVDRVWHEAVRNETPFNGDHRLLLKNGRVKYVNESAQTHYDEQGRPIRIVGMVQDITKRKQMEIELRVNLQKYQVLFNTFPVGVNITDESGRIIEGNPAAERMLQLPAEAQRQRDIDAPTWQIVRPDGAPLPPEAFASTRALREQRLVENVEMGLLFPGHEITWLNVSAAPLPVEGYGVVIAYDDITTRKQAEAELIAHRRRLSAILEGTRVGTWEWHVQSGETVFNEQWANILGYTLAEISPTTIETWARFGHPDDLLVSGELLQRHFAGELAYYEFEARMRHKDGHWVWVLDRGKVATWTDDGRPLLMSGTHQEITARKQMEESLRQAKEQAEAANRAKSAFLANMSHELRTPLNGILGYTQIFKQDRSFTPEQQEGIDIIHRSGKHLLTMINDILDLSKIEANRLELLPETIDLPKFLQVIVEMIRMRAEKKGLALHYRPGPNLPAYVQADETRLRQVLLNLLGNAIKFTRQGSITFSVSVRDKAEGERMRGEVQPILDPSSFILLAFEVADTGSGIDPAQREVIFEPFRQVGDRLGQASGTGLGLSISRQLVQLMGGELHVDSLEPDWHSGSRFWFEIPLPGLVAPPTAPSGSGRPITGYHRTLGSGPLTLLLVDDMAANRLVLKKVLTPLGFKIIEAQDGAEALSLAIDRAPDLIFMDLVMPGQDGLTTVRALRQNEPLRDTPIIAISASVDSETRRQSQSGGCDDFVSKPFVVAEMLAVVQRHLPLVWTYGEAARLPLAEASPAMMTLPPVADLQQLLSQAMGGDVPGIEAYAADLLARSPDYVPFVTHLRQFTDQFELEALEKFIRDNLEAR